jgi:uncharacterized protein (UPF0332 family)
LADLSEDFLLVCSTWTDAVQSRVPEIAEGIQAAARDRLGLARRFAESAASLAESGTEIDLRNAISRAYYACHHAARAVSLVRTGKDEHDHYRAIDAVAAAAKDGDHALSAALRRAASDYFQTISVGQLGAGIDGALSTLIRHRHCADYAPYGRQHLRDARVDFVAVAPSGVRLAYAVVEAVAACLTTRGGT